MQCGECSRLVQCQHGTQSERLHQQKGCTSRLQIRFARFGPHFGSARHGNADPAPARGTSVHSVDWSGAVCVRGFVFLGVCCLIEIGAGLSRVSMPPLMNACSCKRGAPTVFKRVWRVLDATLDLDQPGTAMQTRLGPGAQACTVSTRSGAVCVRDFVFHGVCCLFHIGAGLSRVRMPPLMIACISISGAPTVFK